MIHLKMKNIMKSRKTTDSTRRKGRDAQADPDEDYLDQDYDDYDNEEEERIRRIKNKVLVRVSYLMVALFLSMAGYLIYFNVVLRDDINNNQYNTKQSAYQEQIIRGNIYSADGNVLAQTDIAEDGTESRSYPYSNLFAHIVGYATNGKSGIESVHNYDLLSSHASILDQIREEDKLLSYPYESIRPFLKMLTEAAEDESVISIKMTLYRLAKQSKVVEALCEAAENGKEVVVLVELRARFDEENNIRWSRMLEQAGCQIIYGLEGYKVHSKLCLITRRSEKGIEYITQIGTGNYNEKTARLYTDLCLMTVNEQIGMEAARVFQALTKGEIIEEVDHLMVAPKCLQSKVIALIDEEIRHKKQGEDAYIGLKLNSLTDKRIIDKLVEASKAGVRVDMIIRGICCMVPGIKGETENVHIISIVGRFLEHSRIYIFGCGERTKYYIGSADFMTRNTVKRVEVAAPVYSEKIKKRIRGLFDLMLSDNKKARTEDYHGKYSMIKCEGQPCNSQEMLYQEAYDRAAIKTENKVVE